MILNVVVVVVPALVDLFPVLHQLGTAIALNRRFRLGSFAWAKKGNLLEIKGQKCFFRKIAEDALWSKIEKNTGKVAI